MCITEGRSCTDNMKDRIQTALYRENLKEFLCRKYNLTESTFKRIGWDAHNAAMVKIHGSQKVISHKYIHG